MVGNEYKAAIEKHDAAITAFRAVQKAYRMRLADDDEYLAAKAAYDAATAEFDAAFTKEANRL